MKLFSNYGINSEWRSSEWRGYPSLRGDGDVLSAPMLDKKAPGGFICVCKERQRLRFATDNPQCFTSLLSNTVFLLGALGNLFQQPFPVWRRIVIRIAHTKGFQTLLCGHVGWLCRELASGSWKSK